MTVSCIDVSFNPTLVLNVEFEEELKKNKNE